MAASPIVTAFARQWTRDELLNLERRILDAITTNLAEPVTVTSDSTDGRSTTAVIGATTAERERLLRLVQASIAEKDGTTYSATDGVTIDFSTRITGT